MVASAPTGSRTIEDVMSKPAFTTVLGLCLVVAYASSVPAATPGLRDAANMFPENTLRQADERLTELYRKHGWEIVFETIDTLDGKSIDRVTEDKARSLQVHGVYFLIAKKEHKVHYWIERPALNTFDKAAVESATQKIIGGFKRKKFDEGLLNAVNYLADVGERGPSATTKGLARSAPATSRPDLAPRTDRNTDGSGSFLARVLVIGAVILVALLIIRIIAAISRGASGGPAGAGYGAGGPGYGWGGGGGFFGNLMAGLGGALLGNYLYNSFFGGGQAHADQFGESASSSGNSGTFDDQGVSGGGEWDDSTSGDDTGADGGTGGGDFGDGDMGGGDFGGDTGGGDW